ncbi:MAG: magnesium transporter [Acidobacteria bacterium]|nr:magnesium transporter [Acidobacteriota bacterium]
MSKNKNTMTPDLLAHLREKVKSNPQTVTEVIDQIKAPDAAELINELSLEDAAMTMMLFPMEEAVAIFNEPSCERRQEIIEILESERAAEILRKISSDERSYVIRHLTPEGRAKLVPALPENLQAEIRMLLQFPPTSAGGIMSTEFMHLSPDSSVSEAINHVRANSKQRLHIYSCYVLDDENRLLGAISLRDLVVATPSKAVKDVMRKYPISVHCLDDQEKVARILAKYNLLAVPVVDDNKKVLGFVTIDDALDVIMEEQTEDVHKFGGMEALEEPYLASSVFDMVKKRAGWLIVLFLGEMLTANAMGFFEHALEKAIVLTLFIPLIVSSGGNSGSQATSLIIRAIALNEAKPSDWWRVMSREIASGLMLGTILGTLGFLRIAVVSTFSKNIYGEYWFFIALTLFFTLIGVVLLGTLAGSMLPFILKKIGFDPAAASAPFVATLVDVAGLILYFTLASFILSGKLL